MVEKPFREIDQTFHDRGAGLNHKQALVDFERELKLLATSNLSYPPLNRGRVMSGTLLRPDRELLAPFAWLASQRRRPLRSVLLIEYRDEVFARLESDLRRLGCQVYRASRAEDVLLLYINTPIDVTISNSALPDASAWLSAAKLRMYDRTARLWLYTAQQSIRDRSLIALSGFEKVIRYEGDLFKLTEHLAMLLAPSQVQSDSPPSRTKRTFT